MRIMILSVLAAIVLAIVAASVLDAMQELHAQAVGQAHVGDHRVEALRLQQLPRFCHRPGGFHAVALAQQRQFVERAQVRFVVDNKDLGRACGGGLGAVHGLYCVSRLSADAKET